MSPVSNIPDNLSYEFNEFKAVDYLKEYYDEIEEENEFLLRCYHKFYSNLTPKDKLIEIGGGPTIYSLISACTKVKQIIFAEYNRKNREAVADWTKNTPEAYNWDPYFQFVGKLEKQQNKNVTNMEIEAIKKRLRSCITQIVSCNLLAKQPLESYGKESFDVVSSNFCPESITDKKDMFTIAIENVLSLVKAKGYLLLSMLRGAYYYKVGNMHFPAYKIDKIDIKNLLKSYSYSDIEIDCTDATLDDKGYEGLMVISARKA